MEQLGFEIFGRDRFSATARAAGKSAKQVAADIETANIKVEKSQKALTAAELKYGKGSLQARDAANKLTKAQLGLDSANKQTERSQGRAAKSMDRFRTVATVAGTVVGAALFKIGKDSIRIASDIEESQNKVRVVFGQSAGAVEDMAGRSAKSLGISKREALAAAGTFGNLFVALKLPQPEAAKMSTRMVQLAADMASFNNTTPEEALEALRSGLVGETEPLRKFGVNLNDATIRQQALKMGLISTTKDALSPAVKAQATYALILNQTKTAQGDFARTSGSMANQLKVAKARFSDLQGELGAKLLPAVNGTLSGLLSMADFIGRNHRTIVPLVVIIGTLATTIWTVNTAGKAWVATQKAWVTIGKAVTAVNIAQGTSLGALTKAGGKLLGVLGGVAVIYHEIDRGAPQEAARGLAKDFGGAADSTKRFLNWFSQLFGMTPKYTTAAMQQAAAVRATRDAYGDSRSQVIRQARAMTDSAGEVTRARNAVAAHKIAVNQDTTAVKRNAVAVLAASNTEIGWQQAIDDARQALKDNGRTLDTNTQKGRNNRTMLNNAAAAALAHRDALKENGASQRTTTRYTEQARGELVRMARRLGMNKREAQEYTNKILGIPKRHDTTVYSHTGKAERDLRDFRRRANDYLNGIRDERVSLGVVVNGKRIRIKSTANEVYMMGAGSVSIARATGGPVFGRGTGTSDSIPARLSNGEHVWTAREVAAAGGHAAVKEMRRGVLGYAAGGPVQHRMNLNTDAKIPAWAFYANHLSGAVGNMSNSIARRLGSAVAAKMAAALKNAMSAGLSGGPAGGRSIAALVAFGRWLQSKGYSVTEHPSFGGVGVHSPGSLHYSGRAIDVNRGAGTSSREQAYLRQIIGPAHARGFRTIFMAPGHYNHAHISLGTGGVINEEVFGVGKSGRTYSIGERGQPEAVVPLQRGRGGATVHNHYHFPNYVGDKNDLVRALDDLRRAHRLPKGA